MAKDKKKDKDDGTPDEEEINFDFDLGGLEDTGGKSSDSGSAGGLWDGQVETDPEDSLFAGIFDEAVGIAEKEPQLTKGTKKLPSGHEIMFDNEIMSKQGFQRFRNFYVDKYRAIVFLKKKDALKPKAYVMFGYSLRDFVGELENVQNINCQIGKKAISFYDFVKDLRRKYLKVGGKNSLTPLPDTRKPRIALGYSIAYDSSKEDLENQIKAISDEAIELNEDIRDTLNQACGSNKKKKVKYIRGNRALEMYVQADKQVPAEAAVATAEPASADELRQTIQETQTAYQQTPEKKGKPVLSENQPKKYIQILSAIWLFGKKPKKKSKQ